MKFNLVTPEAVTILTRIVGEEHVVLPAAIDNMLRYTHGEIEDLRYLPEVVLKPANAD